MASPVISGNSITFPAGTPSSVMSAYYNYILRQRAQPQQDWFDRYAQPWIDKTLNPYMADIFLNDPRTRDMTAFNTDQKIRLNQADQDAKTQALLQQARNAATVQQEDQTVTGNAIGGFTNIQKDLTQPAYQTDTGPTQPYGAFEDPWAASPNPQVPTPPPDLGPDQAAVDRSRTMSSSPGFAPSMADVLRTQAGQNPMLAGRMGTMFEKNTNLSNMLDPQQVALRDQKSSLADAQAQLALTRATTMQGDLQRKQDQLNAQKPVYEAQANQAQAKADQLNQLVQTAGGKQAIRDIMYQMVMDGKPSSEIQPYLAALNEKPLAQGSSTAGSITPLKLQLAIATTTDPVERARLQSVLDKDAGRQIGIGTARATATAAATLPYGVASKELPKIADDIKMVETFDSDTEKLKSAANVLNSAGWLPTDPREVSRIKARVSRQMSPWSDEVQQANSTIARFFGEQVATYDRSIKDAKGMRVKELYAIPPDPTLLSYQELQAIFDFWDKGSAQRKATLSNQLQSLPSGSISGTGTPNLTTSPTRKADFRYNPLTGQLEPVQ